MIKSKNSQLIIYFFLLNISIIKFTYADKLFCKSVTSKQINEEVQLTTNESFDKEELVFEIVDLLNQLKEGAVKDISVLNKVAELMDFYGISYNLDKEKLLIQINSNFTGKELRVAHPLNKLAARIKLKYDVDLNYYPGKNPFYKHGEKTISIGRKAVLTGDRKNHSLGHEIRHMYYTHKFETTDKDSIYNAKLSGNLEGSQYNAEYQRVEKFGTLYSTYQSLQEIGTFSQDIRRLARQWYRLLKENGGITNSESDAILLLLNSKIFTFQEILNQTKYHTINSKDSINGFLKSVYVHNDLIILKNKEVTLVLYINDAEIKALLDKSSLLRQILYRFPMKNTFNDTITNYIYHRLDEIISQSSELYKTAGLMRNTIEQSTFQTRIYRYADVLKFAEELVTLSNKLPSKI